ncbi:MAG: bifunctional diaminohydroxyphosphoribosylaminopyrimidine deaminase/5-amino-6-(5-phosphoribosylamino)uracil reductase RibD [Acetobacteraceae bacterium]|nr:bifunctional diaminohydroxyphosphoribosylaminopyrimidine deaminase/5-amino-6-(5-phosphoribosylamino)uracil reductase RibD [Acetobacteraceae bacterium]
MDAALALARRGLGTTWPNPAVGCVLVKDGRVVGRGFTAPGGRPHAETVALDHAGAAARGATAYVTLEPCSHWGQTSPCADALIAAGVKRVVVGARDPDPRVNGAGLERLRAAGIEVIEGVCAAEAAEVLAGFASRVVRGRPLVTLKLASTLDGRIATRTGESRWITGEEARREAHALRGRHDAVMVGVGTVVADDPDLTCRISGFRKRPIVRVVADSGLRTPLAARLVVTAQESPTWIIAGADADPERVRRFREAGLEVLTVEAGSGGVDIGAALRALGSAGITRLLVEGGAALGSSLLREGLVDRIAWFHAGAVMGGDGLPAVQGFGVTRLADMARFRHRCTRAVGGDTLSLFGKD